jgi:hypothetical protein
MALLAGVALSGCQSEQIVPVEELPVLEVEPGIRIEGVPSSLGAIRWAGSSGDSVVALNQVNDHLVRLFDRGGMQVRSIGGPRGGTARGTPFLPLQGGAGWVSDTVWVNDASLGRILLYDEGGEVARTLPPLAGARPGPSDRGRYPNFLFLWPLVVYPGDSVLVLADQPTGGPHQGSFAESMHLLRISADGRIQSYVSPVHGTLSSKPSAADFPSMRLDVPLATLPDFQVSLDGDGIVLLVPDGTEPEEGKARIRVLDSHGSILLERRYRFSEAAGLGGITLGQDRRIWIAVQGPDGERSWVVLNREGEPMARVLFREDSRVLEAGSDYLWISELDDLGAPRVVEYHILGGS